MNGPILFVAGGMEVTPSLVLCASAFWGELDSFDSETRSRIACTRHGQARDIEVDGAELQAASERFRVARGLRTAHATEAWMAAWGVSVESFTDYLERDAFLSLLQEAPAEAEDQDEDAARHALWPDTVFSGRAERWCRQLAERMAVMRDRRDAGDIPSSLFDPAAAPGLHPGPLRRWIGRLDAPPAWFDQLVATESAFARFSESLQSPARMDAVMRARWNMLFTLDFELGSFATEAAAREACLCITEDGVAIDQVCAMAGGVFHAGRAMLSDLPDAVRTRALSATEGALLPVFPWNDGYVVCRVRDKAEPSLDEPRTREAIIKAMLEEAVRPLVQRHIQWSPGIAR